MSVDSLIDTNVVIYLLDDSNANKSQRAEELIQSGLARGVSCISPQVVQETLNVAIGKLGFSTIDAERLLNEILLPLCKPVSIKDLYKRGLSVQDRYQYSFYDSLIIAAALEVNCKVLYTEDLQHDQCIDRLTIQNPFL